jgi:isopenicillin N synthase-like dioxygenase
MHAQVSAKLDAIARAILAAMASAHGLPRGTFSPLTDSATALRAHCLMAMQYDGEGAQLGKKAHVDRSPLTLIWTPVGSALQVTGCRMHAWLNLTLHGALAL